jgi:hypothetical protein
MIAEGSFRADVEGAHGLIAHIIHKFFINEDFYDFWSQSESMEEEYDTVLSRVTL